MSVLNRIKDAASRAGISLPWLAAATVMVLLIWGNSMVPGTESSQISHAVLDMVQGALAWLGLPSQWVTNFLIRKTAHFCEYAVLGVLVSQGVDPTSRATCKRLLLIAALLMLVPSFDETIQLFVGGRSGQATDVLLDCCGAACGVAVRTCLMRLWRRCRG